MPVAPYGSYFDSTPLGHEDLSYRVLSDIFSNEYIAQSTNIIYAKNLIVDILRSIFEKDRNYRYLADPFGFPLTPSQYGLSSDTGLADGNTTRIFIGSTFRYDIKFLPALIVKSTSTKYVPISFNQNMLGVIYRDEILKDGYGNITQIHTPAYNTLVGAWDQTIEIRVVAQSQPDREELAEIVTTTLMSTRRMELQQAGLFIKSISTGGEIEEQYANDFIYMVSINLDCRSEWKVQIPISSVVDKIAFCFDFAYPGTPAPSNNFNYEGTIDLSSMFVDIKET